jgi:hypothetical protein
MNPNMVSRRETDCTIDNTGMFTLTKTWIHNQSSVFSIDIHCCYCDQTYHGHNSTFKKHLSTKKHKNNVREQIRLIEEDQQRLIDEKKI